LALLLFFVAAGGAELAGVPKSKLAQSLLGLGCSVLMAGGCVAGAKSKPKSKGLYKKIDTFALGNQKTFSPSPSCFLH
jgi:hypothetical protein